MKNRTVMVVFILAINLFALPTLAKQSSHKLSQALAEKHLAMQAKQNDDHKTAALHFEKAVEFGLSSDYGLWMAINEHIKAEQHDSALRLMHKAADLGLALDEHFQSLEADFTAENKPLFDAVIVQVKKQAELSKASKPSQESNIYTEDVDRFFVAFDQAEKVKSHDEKRKIYEHLYFDKASIGMVDYVSMKISNTQSFVDHVEKNRAYYEDVRVAVKKVNDLIPTALQAMLTMKEHYPEAPNSDIYFIIGIHTSAGTASSNGILLGADFIAESKDNVGGLKEWTHAYITDAEDKVWVVVHEYVHVLQNTSAKTVLGNALVEGGANFLANLLYAPPKELSSYTQFGMNNENLVLSKFKEQMDSEDISLWTGNNGHSLPEKWAPDLGYFVGQNIAEAYYEQAEDKSQAIRDLLELKDPKAILKKSGYLEL
ncbi:MAG: hypothetical protein ACSHWU_01690 [Marinicella sp.]